MTVEVGWLLIAMGCLFVFLSLLLVIDAWLGANRDIHRLGGTPAPPPFPRPKPPPRDKYSKVGKHDS